MSDSAEDVLPERITETIAFNFDNAEQQRRFHDRLNDPNDWKAIATSLRSELARKEEALRECEEFFDERADADQPAGCDSPIPNDEMKMLVKVRAALQTAVSIPGGNDV